MDISNVRDIEKIGVVDDDEKGRVSLCLPVEDANLVSVPQNESVIDLNEFLATMSTRFDAIVTDHHLRKSKSYFPIDGAELAACCYSKQIPSLLVTRYEEAEISQIRRFRDRIPTVLTPKEFNGNSLLNAFEKCINEFNGVISNDRKAWRTLVRVDDFDENNVYVFVPAWDPQQPIKLNRDNFPPNFMSAIVADMRLFAKVNIGTENPHDLYFKEWESK